MTLIPQQNPVQYTPESMHGTGRKYARASEVIKGYVLEFAQLFFDGKNHPLKWDIDQGKTMINIVDKHTFNLEQVRTHPSIVANRGPVVWAKMGGISQRQHVDFRTGAVTYTDLVRGSVTMSCFSMVGMEADEIAGYLFEGLQSFRQVLRNSSNQGRIISHNMGFFKIEALSMGEEALVKGDSKPNLSVVPVAIAAMAQRRWVVTPASEKLKKIDVNLTRQP